MKKINFKRTYILVTLSAVVALLGFGCKQSFLNNPPLGYLSNAEVASDAGITELLTGCYGALDGNVFQGWDTPVDDWLFGSVCGGEASKGSDPSDQADAYPIMYFQTLPTDSYIENTFQVYYDAINRCNNVLRLIPQATDVTPAEGTEFKAETEFLLGHYYFAAQIMWNNVPYLDQTNSYATGNYQVPNKGPVWPQIEAYFTFAMDSLPATQSLVGRANSWAAATYLAKTYMFEGKFSAAEPLLDNIIANGMTSNGLAYALLPRFSDNFDVLTENGSESIFAYQAAVNTGTNADQANAGNQLNFPYNGPGGCCGFFTPSVEMLNSFRVGPNGLPILGTSGHDYDLPANAVKNDWGIQSNVNYTSDPGPLDPRVDWSIGRRGSPYLDWGPHPGFNWLRNQPSDGPNSPIKAVFRQAEAAQYSDHSYWTPGVDAVNYNIIRFAEVILWDAEAAAQDNNLTKALTLTNEIRQRASNPADFVSNTQNVAYAYAVVGSQAAMLAESGISGFQWVVRSDLGDTWVYNGSAAGGASNIANWNEYKIPTYMIGLYSAADFDTQADALQRIMFEDKLEFAEEGHRFWDLVRWGTATAELNFYFTFKEGSTTDYNSSNVPTFVAPKDNYFPLPQNEIDLSNGTLKQNTGY